MTSKLVSLAKVLYARGALGKTATVPSSWAALRRVVVGDADQEQIEAEERERGDDPLLSRPAVDEESLVVVENAPISSHFAKSELTRFSRDYFRSLLTVPVSSQELLATSFEEGVLRTSRDDEQRRIVEEPDLRVPLGDDFIYLAQ